MVLRSEPGLVGCGLSWPSNSSYIGFLSLATLTEHHNDPPVFSEGLSYSFILMFYVVLALHLNKQVHYCDFAPMITPIKVLLVWDQCLCRDSPADLISDCWMNSTSNLLSTLVSSMRMCVCVYLRSMFVQLSRSDQQYALCFPHTLPANKRRTHNDLHQERKSVCSLLLLFILNTVPAVAKHSTVCHRTRLLL